MLNESKKSEGEKLFDKTMEVVKQLIEIPSYSCCESEIARFIAKKLRDTGAETTLQVINESSANVIAEIKGAFPGPDIILAGHMDTVPVMEGWSKEPFNAIEEGDKIYGLGSCDMKAGIAIALSIAEIAAKNKDKLKGNLKLIFVADEEGYSTGIKKVIEDMNIKADVAFMIEPEYENALIGATGKMLIKVKTLGKSSHAAYPEIGINAIEEASKFIANLNKIKKVYNDRLSYQPFIVFNIKGGYDKYSVTIPDYCEIVINKHTVPGETVEYIMEELKKLKHELGLKSKFVFELMEPYYPPYAIDENSEHLLQLKKTYKEVTGKELGISYGNGVSDANCLVGLSGITTINFGPSGGPIHAPDEWVSKCEIKNVIEVYYKLLYQYMIE